VDRTETRVAILEDGHVAETYIERRGNRSVVGHIWKGRVENVLAGMEAAFVDVGLGKAGFLHVDEVVAVGVPKHKRQIADLLTRGRDVLVQATKDPMGTKGARLTMQLSLAGRHIVYVPYGEGVGVSRRLTDDERNRLRSICGALPLEKGGIIARTAAAGASAGDLARDLAALKRLWETLSDRAARASSPTLLYSEADISLKIIRDLLSQAVDDVLVDDESQHARIVGFLRRTSPALADRVRLWDGPTPLMTEYGVDTAIRSTLQRRVPLASGGSLVIDDTEAMTVIDVNSGRNVGKGSTTLEATITRTNLEAAAEVVRQLRLRDIGGIVIIDFIDMNDERNRQAVRAALDEALSRDRTRTFVVDISPLGLVEMTRQNVSDGPREVMTEACPTCGGDGVVLSEASRAIDLERELRAVLADRPEGEVTTVAVHPSMAAYLTGEEGSLADLEAELRRAIRLKPDASLAPGAMKLQPQGRQAAQA
jgi:ribonuclease G